MAALRILCLAALPFVAGAALAQAAPKPTAPAAAPQPQITIPGVSQAGVAVLNKMRNMPDNGLKMIIGQLRDVSSQLALEIQRPVIDVDKIAALLKKREMLMAQSQTRQDDRLVAVIKALPAADRAPFLRAVSGPPAGAQPH